MSVRRYIIIVCVLAFAAILPASETKVPAEARADILGQMLQQSRLQVDYNTCTARMQQIPGEFAQRQAQIDQLKAKAIAEAKLGGEPADWDIDTDKWIFVKKSKPAPATPPAPAPAKP